MSLRPSENEGMSKEVLSVSSAFEILEWRGILTTPHEEANQPCLTTFLSPEHQWLSPEAPEAPETPLSSERTITL